jgi:c-di-GMP-binding flagellar brake protein YcgR
MNIDFKLNTILEDVLDDELFSVTTPIWQGQYYKILPRDALVVSFFHDGIRQVFHAVPAGEYGRGALSFLTLRKTSPIEEIQLRADYRVPLDDEARIIFSVEDDGVTTEYVRLVRLRDLSGGGVGFYTDWNPDSITNLKVQIRLESSTEEITAQVRRIEERMGDPRTRFAIGAKFVYDTDREKDRIVRHIFKLQQKRIQEQKKKVAAIMLD